MTLILPPLRQLPENVSWEGLPAYLLTVPKWNWLRYDLNHHPLHQKFCDDYSLGNNLTHNLKQVLIFYYLFRFHFTLNIFLLIRFSHQMNNYFDVLIMKRFHFAKNQINIV